jgi:hypothetical protein
LPDSPVSAPAAGQMRYGESRRGDLDSGGEHVSSATFGFVWVLPFLQFVTLPFSNYYEFITFINGKFSDKLSIFMNL